MQKMTKLKKLDEEQCLSLASFVYRRVHCSRSIAGHVDFSYIVHHLGIISFLQTRVLSFGLHLGLWILLHYVQFWPSSHTRLSRFHLRHPLSGQFQLIFKTTEAQTSTSLWDHCGTCILTTQGQPEAHSSSQLLVRELRQNLVLNKSGIKLQN